MWLLNLLDKFYGFKTIEQRQQSVIDWQSEELRRLREELRMLKERENSLVVLPRIGRGVRYKKVVLPKELLNPRANMEDILSEYLPLMKSSMAKDCKVVYE